MSQYLITDEKSVYIAHNVHLLVSKEQPVVGTLIITNLRTIFNVPDSNSNAEAIPVSSNLIEIPHWTLYKILILENKFLKAVIAQKKYKNCDSVILQCSNSRHLALHFDDVANFDINALLSPLTSYTAASIYLNKAQRAKKVLPKVFKKIKSKFGDHISIPANLDYQYCKSHLVGVHGESYNFKLENVESLLAFSNLDIFIASAKDLENFVIEKWQMCLDRCDESQEFMTSTNTEGLNTLLGSVLVRPKNPSITMDSSNVGANEYIPLFSYRSKTSGKVLYTKFHSPNLTKLEKKNDPKDDDTSKASLNSDWNFILPSNMDKNSTVVFDLDSIFPKMSIISKSFYSFCKVCCKNWSISWFKLNRQRNSSSEVANSQHDLSVKIKNRAGKTTPKNSHSNSKNYKWLKYVGRILKCGHDITTKLKTGHVIVKSSSFGLLPIVSSLVKIMLDPFYRTIEGFWCLITEEWLSKKYKFNPSVENLHTYGYAYEPSLVLFFSAIHNLSLEYYMEFEYDTNFLLFISDLLPSGLFHSYQQAGLDNNFISGLNPFKLMELWNRFRNHLYYQNLCLEKKYTPQVLDREIYFCNLELWDEYFLRWTPKADNFLAGKDLYKSLLSILVQPPTPFSQKHLLELAEEKNDRFSPIPRASLQNFLNFCLKSKANQNIYKTI